MRSPIYNQKSPLKVQNNIEEESVFNMGHQEITTQIIRNEA